MKNTRFAIATALTGALTLAGCTAAAASGTAGAGHAAPLSGLTHVVAYSINTDSPVLTCVVSGAIGDYGPAEEVSQSILRQVIVLSGAGKITKD